MALELNLLRFVALLAFRKNNRVWIACKYFLVQRLGSALFLLTRISASWLSITSFLRLLILALILKLAIAPFQFWIVNIAISIS